MPRPKSDIDLRIIHAARSRFLHDGVDGASLRRIAEEASTNVGMIYYYFPTKEDLFLAVVEEIYSGLLENLTEALDPAAPVEQRFERLFARFAAMSEDELTVVRLVMREALVSSERRRRIIDRFMRGHAPMVIGTVMDGLSTGVLTARHGVPVLAVATIALAVLPQVARRLFGADAPPGVEIPAPEELSRALLDVLLHGIAQKKRAPLAGVGGKASRSNAERPKARPKRGKSAGAR